MIKRKELEVVELLNFLARISFYNEYITQKKIEEFNRFKDFVKIKDYKFIRSQRNKSNLKKKDNDILLLKITRGLFAYMVLIIEIRELQDKEINLLRSFLEYIENGILFCRL